MFYGSVNFLLICLTTTVGLLLWQSGLQILLFLLSQSLCFNNYKAHVHADAVPWHIPHVCQPHSHCSKGTLG